MTDQDDFDEYYDDGSCGGCMCCDRDGCHMGPDSTCPTNSLGEYACPCTCS